MKIKMKLLTTGILTGLVLFLGACSSTKVTSSWKEPETSLQKDQKIMVLGLVNDREGRLRGQMEKEMVLALKKQGYQAVSAYDEFGPKAFRGLKEEQALNKLRKGDIDKVLTIVMLDKSKEKSYVPGNNFYGPFGSPFYGRWWGYYNWMYGRVYDPGYYTTNTRYFLESNLYSISDKQLLYSIQTETFDPASAERMAVVYTNKVVADMTRQQLIGRN
ncbi:hypothetical protein [Chitinophaga rhizosphaerae]|uniref:hypothetical protein n=1 Tax=Chitinophaga rhizosphaerae TaxID=1864947 RepID=UPI000F80EBF2|nr:hypothetical protein [Chitinophaga rhizosphaerae]